MKKIILSLILIFFVSISTVRVYGYYDDLNTPYLSENSKSIRIVQKMSSNKGKELVPRGVILGVNDTEEIVFTYKVFIQNGISFEYYINNITINNDILSEELEDLFNFEIKIVKLEKENIQANLFDEKLEGNYYEITVTLSMNMPTEEQFYSISGQQLRFEFTVKNVI